MDILNILRFLQQSDSVKVVDAIYAQATRLLPYSKPSRAAVERALARGNDILAHRKTGLPILKQPSLDGREVVELFGGARKLMAALATVGHPRDAATVYKWTYPYPKGTGGHLPRQAEHDIVVAAERFHIDLSKVGLVTREIAKVRRRSPKRKKL